MRERKYILYKHTAPNGKVYIGITCKTIASRWGVEGNGYVGCPHFWNAINKYGWENIKHEILLYDLSKDEACEKEKEYISKYRSNDSRYGYNMTSGGDIGFKLSPDARAKISTAAKRQWEKMTQEERDAYSRRNKEIHANRTETEIKEICARAQRTIEERYTPEEKAEWYKVAAAKCRATKLAKYGTTHPPEQRAAHSVRMKKYWDEYHLLHPKKKKKYWPPKVKIKRTREEVSALMSESMKKKWQEPEYLEKMRIAAASRKHHHFSLSEETKVKMRKPKSEATKAKMRKPKSEETKKKMSEAKKKYFANMTPEQRQEFANKFRKKAV